tara:strand:- start:1062 stop:1955 length:894 start_codon:yes stop_codon:yes gene_type:complete
MNSFIYCIDTTYNVPCYLSIQSLIKCSEEFLDIHIIHSNPASFNKFKNNLEIKNKKIRISLYRIENNFDYPNLEDRHVSMATYFRLFIGDYINKELKNLIYIDADAFAINNFDEIVTKTFEEMNQKNFTIAALDVNNYDNETRNKPYFNAGVLFIDYEKWLNNEITKKLKTETQKDFFYHDQDILNNYFKDNFLNMNKWLNMHVVLEDYVFNQKLIEEEAFFVHYVGKTKPWDLEGLLKLNSVFYHQLVKEYNNGELFFKKVSYILRIKFLIINFFKILKHDDSIYFFRNILTSNSI